MREKPDTTAVLKAAQSILSRCGQHGLSDGEIGNKIDEILFEPRNYWKCIQQEIITKEELANVLLAHLDTLVERSCGRRFFDPLLEQNDNDLMQRALFGS